MKLSSNTAGEVWPHVPLDVRPPFCWLAEIRVYHHEKIGEKSLARIVVVIVINILPTCLLTVFVPFTHSNLNLPKRVCQL